MGIAAVFDEIPGVGEYLALFGNARRKRGAIDDQAEGIALDEGA